MHVPAVRTLIGAVTIGGASLAVVGVAATATRRVDRSTPTPPPTETTPPTATTATTATTAPSPVGPITWTPQQFAYDWTLRDAFIGAVFGGTSQDVMRDAASAFAHVDRGADGSLDWASVARSLDASGDGDGIVTPPEDAAFFAALQRALVEQHAPAEEARPSR